MRPFAYTQVNIAVTKVAYTYRKDGAYADIRDFQSWTNLGIPEDGTRLLPTVLAYEKGHNLQDHAPTHIGFLQEDQKNDDDLEVYEWFKEHFPGNLPHDGQESERHGKKVKVSPIGGSRTDTMILYHHFLSKIYVAIKSTTSNLLGPLLGPEFSWENTCIEFIFSIPATWNRLTETLEDIHTRCFKDIVTDAGFGKHNSNHRVRVGLTEPEAAAAFCLANQDNKHYLEVRSRIASAADGF